MKRVSNYLIFGVIFGHLSLPSSQKIEWIRARNKKMCFTKSLTHINQHETIWRLNIHKQTAILIGFPNMCAV